MSRNRERHRTLPVRREWPSGAEEAGQPRKGRMIKDKAQWINEAKYLSRDIRMTDLRQQVTSVNGVGTLGELALVGHDPKLDGMIENLKNKRLEAATARVEIAEYLRSKLEKK